MKNKMMDYIYSQPSKRITYSDYMGMALYDPDEGYYMKRKEKIGRNGDFITTSNVADIYGQLLAKWVAKLVVKSNLPLAFCEVGGGNGRFAKAFLQEWSKQSSKQLNYYIVEESPYHRELQLEELKEYISSVKQIRSLAELTPFNGIIFSNELFDALPVHVIEKNGEMLEEVMITVSGAELSEINVPLENEKILKYLENHELTLSNHQRIEIPLAMEMMMEQMSNVLETGIVLTVDYGYTNEEWCEPARKKGSLRGYYKHQLIEDVLQNPGEMDLTSHVHFDAFIQLGEEKGLSLIKKLRQDEFFLKIGILEELQENYDPNPFSEKSKRNRAIRSLVVPSSMSNSFHVIVQHRGLSWLMDDIIV
ncbi:SAM-dependent methyltransferase [Cytobacillus spongiae]|uniref:class I SAM-dependent methyltransferase n=1 Tax=Cytobacillus spongiae TaxID=2901381 RepID=UPI001F2A8D84|nr:SAM-dependent methyltransferase [Cytobacillus spongiae]UII54841.1 SAM-dependent methyltransferase [Cytobacillus spongiae]